MLLADISGSMEPYARAYLHLLHGAVRATRAEAFVFATRLTRLTRALAVTDPDLALARAAAAMPDWSGGTRIGAALKDFNDGYGRRGMARGAVVVIVSDGWERDDPRLLGEQMARLARLAHRIVWVNPRAAAPAFEPLVGWSGGRAPPRRHPGQRSLPGGHGRRPRRHRTVGRRPVRTERSRSTVRARRRRPAGSRPW